MSFVYLLGGVLFFALCQVLIGFFDKLMKEGGQ